jgi:hypothetical protein
MTLLYTGIRFGTTTTGTVEGDPNELRGNRSSTGETAALHVKGFPT